MKLSQQICWSKEKPFKSNEVTTVYNSSPTNQVVPQQPLCMVYGWIEMAHIDYICNLNFKLIICTFIKIIQNEQLDQLLEPFILKGPRDMASYDHQMNATPAIGNVFKAVRNQPCIDQFWQVIEVGSTSTINVVYLGWTRTRTFLQSSQNPKPNGTVNQVLQYF